MRIAGPPLLAVLLGAAAPPSTLPASIDGLPIGALPPQKLPARGCAAYLFTTGATRAFAAMATTDPATLTLAPGGTATALARTAAVGTTGRGFPASATFAAAGLSVTLSLTVADRPDLQNGAAVPEATLTLARAGADTVVVPLAGLVACKT